MRSIGRVAVIMRGDTGIYSAIHHGRGSPSLTLPDRQFASSPFSVVSRICPDEYLSRNGLSSLQAPENVSLSAIAGHVRSLTIIPPGRTPEPIGVSGRGCLKRQQPWRRCDGS